MVLANSWCPIPALFRCVTSALLLLLAGCGEGGAPSGEKKELLFPEIQNMALVIPGRFGLDGSEGEEGMFFIDRYEVTDGEYHEFLLRSGYRPEDPTSFLDHWTQGGAGPVQPKPGMKDFPVRFVNFHDARAYAQRIGKDLPTRDQWLRGAIGTTSGKKFPWGNQFSPFFCNSYRSQIHGPSRVGTFENGKSELGCYDMVGNVAEWCTTPVEKSYWEDKWFYRSVRAYYTLGGSFSEGGTSAAEEEAFNLSNPAQNAEPGSRSSTLGFRCVRSDALSYIRDVIPARIAALPPGDRGEAFKEISQIMEPLYTVLKGFQFRDAVERTLLGGDPPLLIHPLMGKKGPRLLLGYEDGRLGIHSIEEGWIWSSQGSEEDAPYRFILADGEEAAPPRIIMQPVLKNDLFTVWDVMQGRDLWKFTGRNTLQHVVPFQDGRGLRRLLIGEHTDYRFEEVVLPLNAGLERSMLRPERYVPASTAFIPRIEDFYFRVDFYAWAMLTREALKSPLREKRIAFFYSRPDQVGVDKSGSFLVDNFGNAGLHITDEIKRSIQIQMTYPEYWKAEPLEEYLQVETRRTPGCRLTLYDLEKGTSGWSLELPQALFDFEGVIQAEPLIFGEGGRIAVMLAEDSSLYPPGRTRLYLIDAARGALLDGFELNTRGERITDFSKRSSASLEFFWIVDGSDLQYLRADGAGRPRVVRRTLTQLLQSTGAVYMLDPRGRRIRVQDLSARVPWLGMDRGGAPLLDSLWNFPVEAGPWLLTKPDGEGKTLLFVDFLRDGFDEAYILDGIYNRFAYLSGDRLLEGRGILLVWGSAGNLICFDVKTSSVRWRATVHEISELAEPVLSSVDGTPVVLLTSPLGEITAVDLATGRVELHLMKRGATLTGLLPCDVDQDAREEILLCVKEEGMYVLDPLKVSTDPANKNFVVTLKALEAWRAKEAGR